MKKFLQGTFDNSLMELEALSKEKLNDKQRITLDKVARIFFLSQLLDMPTLHSILEHYGLKRHYLQLDYRSLNKTMSNQLFSNLLSSIFEDYLEKEIIRRSELDSSVWSREPMTAIIDDSIFKQWLPNLVSDPYWGSFFSGQVHRTAYGFKVVTLGVSIDGVFYPLYIDFVKKKKENQPIDKQSDAVKVAKGLLEKFGTFIQKLRSKGVELPTLYLSVDSGYNHELLIEESEKQKNVYIGVPKKNNIVQIDGQKMNIKELTEEFEKQEKQSGKDKDSQEPFQMRIKAFYVSKKTDVVLLLFRLNRSDKISVVYTTHLSIFAKTLRTHWFDRTYIEQFFKLLKHSMKIQMSKTSTKERFEQKLWLFMFVAIQLQLLVKMVQKYTRPKEHRKIGLEALKNLLRSQDSYPQYLLEQLIPDPFCKKNKQ